MSVLNYQCKQCGQECRVDVEGAKVCKDDAGHVLRDESGKCIFAVLEVCDKCFAEC